MGRILAIDYGTKRTGIAVSDPLRLIAGGLETVETKGLEAWLAKYFAAEDVTTIVVGKPTQMDGTPSETWRFVEPLAARLRRAYPDKEVVFHDERFTSMLAHRTMLESGIGRMARRNKALVDKISATIILQSYMEFNKLIYPIVIYGNEVLRKQCEEIAPDYPEVKKLVEDMFQTLGEAEGVGLAAPQIGKAIRLFIVDCTPWGEDDPECADYKRAFINPEIYAFSEEKKTYNEGCLSFPGIHADVPRSLAIRMRYLDENFVEHDEEFHGLKAWVIQHEYDHIEGVVFTDRISPLRRNLLKGKLLNLAKGKYRAAYKTR